MLLGITTDHDCCLTSIAVLTRLLWQVGFYQISKIAVAPVVLVAEAIFFGKRANRKVRASLICTSLAGLTVPVSTRPHPCIPSRAVPMCRLWQP